MSTLSTHVLDTARGCPAEGLTIDLCRKSADGGDRVGGGQTDSDGRVRDLLAGPIADGVYRITFRTGAWYEARGERAFYPKVPVYVEVGGDAHCHVPLRLSPFGYSTYRGS